MKVFCYGDSNTWGDNGSGGRHPIKSLWPNVLSAELGSSHEVYFDGLNGRTATNSDKKKDYYNGKIGFKIALRREQKPDHIVIALGVNDLKPRYNLSADEIFSTLKWYREYANEYYRQDLDFTYVFFGELNRTEQFQFNPKVFNELQGLIKKQFASVVLVEDFDFEQDELHFTVEDHIKLGELVANKIKDKYEV